MISALSLNDIIQYVRRRLGHQSSSKITKMQNERQELCIDTLRIRQPVIRRLKIELTANYLSIHPKLQCERFPGRHFAMTPYYRCATRQSTSNLDKRPWRIGGDGSMNVEAEKRRLWYPSYSSKSRTSKNINGQVWSLGLEKWIQYAEVVVSLSPQKSQSLPSEYLHPLQKRQGLQQL